MILCQKFLGGWIHYDVIIILQPSFSYCTQIYLFIKDINHAETEEVYSVLILH